MKGISINGQKLHDVRMLLMKQHKGSVSYSSYPKERIGFKRSDTGMVLRIPPLLVVELYRRGILPREAGAYFPVAISGKRVGRFRIVDFRYPNSVGDGDPVVIMLERHAPGAPPSSLVS